jgi:phage tail P2-like protein
MPPNATRLDRAAESVMVDAVDAIPQPHRALWNPDTCPSELLPWLAWAVCVEGWRPEWTDDVKRARIKASIGIHRHKGTLQAVEDAIQSFGAHIAIREWWQTEPRGEPHTFELVLALSEVGDVPAADLIEDVIAEVNLAKPLRSHFTFILGLSSTASMAVSAVGRPATYARLDMAVS